MLLILLLWVVGLGMSRAGGYVQEDTGRVFTGGIKLETNIFGYQMTGISHDVAHTVPGVGVGIGGFMFFDIHRHLALQMDLFYHFKQTTVVRPGIRGALTHLSIEIPFYVIGQWRFRNHSRIYVGTGPDVEFGYYAVLRSGGQKFDLYKKDDDTELSAMQNTAMGWVVMAGYEFPFGLQVNVAYTGCFYNVLEANRTEVGCYPLSLRAGVAYRFGVLVPKAQNYVD